MLYEQLSTIETDFNIHHFDVYARHVHHERERVTILNCCVDTDIS